MNKGSILRNWLALNHLAGFRENDSQLIANHIDSDESLFIYSTKTLLDIGFSESLIKRIKELNWQLVDKEERWAEEPGHLVLTLSDDRYPPLLKEISSPPPALFVLGEYSCLSQPQLAMVGSRNPSRTGIEIATEFAKYIAARDIVITSGLAIGIDRASHEGALLTGKTIAVLGTGIDIVYPKFHVYLYERIIEKGAVVSEFYLGTAACRENFPRRNRIISGLSFGTLVVEATTRSGSLITARLANEQGRDVFAIPGSIRSPLSKGCHFLIKDGAKLIENPEEILSENSKKFSFRINSLEQKIDKNQDKKDKKNKKDKKIEQSLKKAISLDKTQQMLLSCIGFEMTSIDIIIERSQLSPQIVISMLLLLEMHGFVQAIPGGYIRVDPKNG